MNFLTRTEALIGIDAIEILKKSKIAVIGVGGVGGFCFEALVRSGIEKFLIVDKDTVEITNLNRQIIATRETLGKDKVEVAKERALTINPDIEIEAIKCTLDPEIVASLNLSEYDYVVDAIDDIPAKVAIITNCKENNVNIISAMGAGKKLDPTKFKVSDIHKTSVDPLARKMRALLREKNIKNVKVVYSDEETQEIDKSVIASISFMPSVMGLIMASEVIKDLIKS